MYQKEHLKLIEQRVGKCLNILMLLFFPHSLQIYNLLFAMQHLVHDSNTHYFNYKIEFKLKNNMDQIEFKKKISNCLLVKLMVTLLFSCRE